MITIIKTIGLLLISLSFAFAQLQSHPLSEIKPIDVNLDMFLKNITNVSYVGINTSYPLYPLHVIGDVYWSGILRGGVVPWNLLSGYDLNVNWIGKLGWRNLTNYPSACPSGYAVQAIGDTLTCIQINTTQGIVNGSGTANRIPVFTGSQTIGDSWLLQTGNTLTLDSGYNFNIVSGALQIGGTTVIDSSRNLANINQITAAGPMNIDSGTLYVDSSNDRVGIGTTTPSYKLDVSGSGRFTDALYLTNSMDQLRFEPSGTKRYWFMSKPTDNKAFAWYSPDEIGWFMYVPNGTGGLIIPIGNVGIGTTSPIKKLDVVGDINATQAIYSNQGYYVGTTQIITSGRVLQNIANVGTNLIPSSDNTYNLGSLTNRWKWVNATNINATQSVRASQICIGNDCRNAWPTLTETDPYWSGNISSIQNNYLIKRSSTGISQSIIYDTGTNVGIETTSPVKKLDVVGDINATQAIYSNQGYYVGTTQIITSGRVLQNIANVGTNLIPSSDNTYNLGSSSNRWGNIYAVNIYGTFSPSGDVNMQGYSIYNANWVNATNVNATQSVRASIIYQGNNQVIDTINANAPITVSGSGSSRTIGLQASGVTAGTYGSASQVAQFVVDQYGRITSASDVNIAIDASQIVSGIISSARLDSNIAWLNRSQIWTQPQTFNENVWFNKNVFIAGNLSYVNVATLNVNGSMIPIFNNQFDLGNSSNKWRNVTAVNIVGDYIYEGGQSLASKYVPQSRKIYTGAGLTGGGDLSADRTISIAFGTDFLGWGNLTNYPSACPSGYAVQAIGDTLTCIQINATQGVVNGSGTANYIPIWTSSSTLGNSVIYQSGGNVGIGTTTPSEKLDIEGGSADVYLKLHTADGYSSGIKMYGGSVDIWGIRYSDTDNKLYIEKDGTQYVSVISGGNVGIGTTSPSQKLTVAGNIGIQAGVNAFIGTLDNYALSLRTNNIDQVFITNDGKVGIGTTTPVYKLDVSGTGRITNAGSSFIIDSNGDVWIKL
ncbi:MAG: hypothetical protein QW156_04890 [Candidatus Aenigmatarchaeota archaeon]